jgi:hypothetical protein
MNLLAFVNWQSVHAMFCVLMWVLVIVLALVLLIHGSAAGALVHHQPPRIVR